MKGLLTLSNIYDGAFLGKQSTTTNRSIYSQKAPSKMSCRVANTLLIWILHFLSGKYAQTVKRKIMNLLLGLHKQ